ncbi:MAG: hypothetical protein ACE5HT_07965 [Gemmatimonadales bacterium]
MPTRSSIAVILNAGGAALDLAALRDIPEGRLVKAEFAASERASCVAATVQHECSDRDFVGALRTWAHGRGWSVAVASSAEPH